jgi:ABC-type microcin C transport system permease subunit YejE
MKSQTTKKQIWSDKLKSHKKLVWGIGIFIALYIASLFTPFISNYTQFPLYVIKCGGLPITAHAGRNYVLPRSRIYKITIFEEAYFCTEVEAQDAGYHKSPLN